MQLTNEHIDRRVQYTDRSGNVSYGTIRSVTGNFVDIAREGFTPRTFYVPMNTLVLVDEEGIPLTE
jgi:hypothetical protein